MTTDGWTQLRRYAVWSSEDEYAFVEVWRHTNGWHTVNANDGTMADIKPYKTRSVEWAYRHAQGLIEEYVERAEEECVCLSDPLYAREDREECADPSRNPYNDAHGVRWHVYDESEGRTLEPYEL